jgi:dTDP-glucose 4,6-dehydratase
MTSHPLALDLAHVLDHTRPLWEELRGERLFITGGTGFFGCWLLETFLWANDALGLNAQAVVLTRDPARFAAKAPHLASHPAIALHSGDVVDFSFPAGSFSHVIHAATDASAKLNAENPLRMVDTIVAGTRRTLDFACAAGARKFLLTSSGAVYGAQPPELPAIPEGHAGAPDPVSPRSAYGEGKRMAELLTVLYGRTHGFESKIARCYAFYGPYLPLDGSFAAGNFMRDALAGGPIVIKGDGTPMRSYLYAADLAVWLWTMLFKAPAGRAYNVGSGEALSIAEMARRTASRVEPAAEVVIQTQATHATASDYYVPSVERAADELGLKAWIELDEGLRRTIAWHRGGVAAQAPEGSAPRLAAGAGG